MRLYIDRVRGVYVTASQDSLQEWTLTFVCCGEDGVNQYTHRIILTDCVSLALQHDFMGISNDMKSKMDDETKYETQKETILHLGSD